jgi:hypothetical protein
MRWLAVAAAALSSSLAFAQSPPGGAAAGRWLAQAEPAPSDYVPPAQRAWPQPQPQPPPSRSSTERGYRARWNLALSPRLVLRLGSGPAGLPVVGWGGGVRLHAALMQLGPLRFGVGAQFAFDKVARDKPTQVLIFTSTTQQLAHATFGAVIVMDAQLSRVRPWLAAGGGFSMASYDDPSVDGMPPKDVHDFSVVGLALISAGVGVRVYESVELGLHTDAQLTFSPNPAFAPGLIAVAADVAFRF